MKETNWNDCLLNKSAITQGLSFSFTLLSPANIARDKVEEILKSLAIGL